VQESTHIEDPPVAVRVTRRVKPGRVEEFEEWVSGITAATSRFPGYLGTEVLKPGDPSDTDYHIIFKFDHMSDLKRWEDSDERRDWCLRVEPLQEGRPTDTSWSASRGGSCCPRSGTPRHLPATRWSR
jgi:antibiotic biosynthesis monooxygenase (ABM) superfamily enzyme